jgi:hypothetical protein
MEVTLVGMVTEVREEQERNAASPKDVTPLPMVMENREVQ